MSVPTTMMMIHRRYQMMFAFYVYGAGFVCAKMPSMGCAAQPSRPLAYETESNLSDCLQNYYLLLFNQVLLCERKMSDLQATWASTRDKFYRHFIYWSCSWSPWRCMSYWQVNNPRLMLLHRGSERQWHWFPWEAIDYSPGEAGRTRYRLKY